MSPVLPPYTRSIIEGRPPSWWSSRNSWTSYCRRDTFAPAPHPGGRRYYSSLEAQDREIQEIKERIPQGKAESFHQDAQGVLWFEDRICVSDQANLRQQILREAHESAYSIHPGSTKM